MDLAYMFWAGSLGTIGIWCHRAHYTTLGAVCHDNQARLGQLTYWVTLGWADMPVEVYFGWGIRVCCRSVVLRV